MKMNIVLSIVVLIAAGFTTYWLINKEEHSAHGDADHHTEEAQHEIEKGPNGGRLLESGDFALEITIFERGVPPEFRLFAYQNNQLVNPENVKAEIKLLRLDGQIDTHLFRASGEGLRGDSVVTEPHSFDVQVNVDYQGKKYHWAYENYEGRVTIDSQSAIENGIVTELAKPQIIEEYLPLNGHIEVDPKRLSHVRARFPGLVKKVAKSIGQRVRKGDLLAVVQSDESLQDYSIYAPISGIILEQDIQAGEAIDRSSLFTIADLSVVWAQLDIFPEDLKRVDLNQSVSLTSSSGETYNGKINWLSPIAQGATQTVKARVEIRNKNQRFRPGQFVQATVSIAQHKVSLAVKNSAIQQFRDFKVVFAQIGEQYEVRMLELGRQDNVWTEVLGGLKPDTRYVTENSFLIKADIEKSGASHDH